MTLEEYRKQLGGKRHQPKFKLRKPGEGEDNAQWKEYSLLKKDDEQEELDVDSDGSDGVVSNLKFKLLSMHLPLICIRHESKAGCR